MDRRAAQRHTRAHFQPSVRRTGHHPGAAAAHHVRRRRDYGDAAVHGFFSRGHIAGRLLSRLHRVHRLHRAVLRQLPVQTRPGRAGRVRALCEADKAAAASAWFRLGWIHGGTDGARQRRAAQPDLRHLHRPDVDAGGVRAAQHRLRLLAARHRRLIHFALRRAGKNRRLRGGLPFWLRRAHRQLHHLS